MLSGETVVVDSIHGDIHLKPREQRIVDTASFQRLRHLKQLGMGQVTYPNATHTRFAHSLGVLGVMARITQVAHDALHLSDEQRDDVRLAALLHDIGHYPYSHLMEKVDKVRLTEELVAENPTADFSSLPYPGHEEVGELILTSQRDLITAIGGKERAQRIAGLFRSRPPGQEQLSKLVHSSLDMDRLDYLLRDARATGVPYGMIDLNYLLNNLKVSPSGMLGVSDKALPAAEQCLFARFFMHRAVYYHKTTFGLEEACRQLLRRLRDAGTRGLARDGDAIRTTVTSTRLGEFTDAYVDGLVLKAARSRNPVIEALANAIRNRRPPKLLKEVCVLEESGKEHHAGATFKQRCKHTLGELARENNIPLELFLFCELPKPLVLEQRGSSVTAKQARKLVAEEREDLIKVFLPGEDEPVSLVDIPYSLLNKCSNYFFQAYRLYIVREDLEDDKLKRLRDAVKDWDET
ncbi:MAG TPA: HD domain-containing protein [Phycisphaerae bacterium]|nr:HD domain-containing protein [Phycisphaerae bacterium]HNU43681.1 HD domain-containing protein [Phycisphaerae bacterium]